MKYSFPQEVFSQGTTGWVEFKLIHDSICLFLSNTLNSEPAAFTEFPVTSPIRLELSSEIQTKCF